MTYTSEELDRLYREIFEDDRRGATLLDDLSSRFAKGPPSGFDVAAVNQTFAQAHQRKVIDYIIARINRANGVQGVTDE
jgi:hypothetical protein